MVDKEYIDNLIEKVEKMDENAQKQLMAFAQSLVSRPPGIPGYLAVQYAREINFPPEDLAEMEKAILEAREDARRNAEKHIPEVKFDE